MGWRKKLQRSSVLQAIGKKHIQGAQRSDTPQHARCDRRCSASVDGLATWTSFSPTRCRVGSSRRQISESPRRPARRRRRPHPRTTMAKKKKPRQRLDVEPTDSLYLQPRGEGGGVRLAAPAAQAAPPAAAAAPSFRGLETFATAAPSRGQKKPETAGAKWGHMKAPVVKLATAIACSAHRSDSAVPRRSQLTEEIKRELALVRMRGSFDPKRFYRASDNKKTPKFFQASHAPPEPAPSLALSVSCRAQMGTVIDDPSTMPSERMTNKARKRTMLQARSPPAHLCVLGGARTDHAPPLAAVAARRAVAAQARQDPLQQGARHHSAE